MKKESIKIFYLILIVFFYSCSNDLDDNYQDLEPLVSIPDNFPNFIDSQTNPLTREGILLGKKLFYDKRLSGNNMVSCATCHNQELAFSDGVSLSSAGISGNTLLRNSPALINLAWADNGLFWDGGSTNLESQAFAPLAHHDEMFQNLTELVEELNADLDYVMLFQGAFNGPITQANIVKALAQFERTMVSGNSRYDKFLRGEAGGNLSNDELQGLALAQQLCFSCHSSILLTDNRYHNNGLDTDFSDASHEGMFQGRFRVTNNVEDLGKYKTPTLRNIEKTAPYMHDGRLLSLEEVINHYASGVSYSSTLDPLLQQNNTLGFSLSDTEKAQIIAFLKTLTDYDFLNDSQFSEN